MPTIEQGREDDFIREEGPKIRDYLIKSNPLLRPDTLQAYIPGYKNWMSFRHGYRLWSSLEQFSEVLRHYYSYPKVVVGLSGISAGGKDALREEMARIAPGFIRRMVTATSRPPKSGETDGVDYYFYTNPDAFLQAVAEGEFIESVQQGNRWYGLPKRSVSDALAGADPIVVTHVEMLSGWLRLEAHLNTTYTEGERPYILRVFMLPEMTAREYFLNWLPARRPAEEVESRAYRAAVEIWEAPHRGDFLITNVMSADRPTLTWEATTLLGHMSRLLRPEIRVPVFPDPPSLGVGWLPDVPAAQDAVRH